MSRALPLLLSICSCVAYAQTTIHVPGDQPTIQAGINAANNGDTVLVADGHYHEHIDFNGKNITVTSVNGPAVTIIDGDLGAGPVVHFHNQEARAAVLHGFTVEHATGPQFDGGGVEIQGASPTITGNVITHNQGAGMGGGINVSFGGPIIDSNTISANAPEGLGGAGISVGGTIAPPLTQITNNIITGNIGPISFGGGIELNSTGPVIVANNIISNNVGSNGGAISIQNGSLNDGPIIVQNLITGNSAPSGAGVFTFTPMQLINNTFANNNANGQSVIMVAGNPSTTTIENNIIVVNNTDQGLFCNPFFEQQAPIVRFNDVFSSQSAANAYTGLCSGFSGSNGNISADPLFISSSDFHLFSGSPVIDAGDNTAANLPALDLDGNPRIVDGNLDGTATIDMGVYEFQFPSFAMSAAQPASLTMVNGAVSLPITFQLTANFYGTVTLSCPGAPTGVSCNFSPATVSLQRAPSPVTLNVTTAANTPLGSYSLTISAAAAGIVVPQTQTIGLTVNAGTGTTDLAVTATHSPKIARVGGTLTFVFTVANTGQDVTGVNLNTVIAGSVLSVQSAASQGACTGSGPVNCTLGAIPNAGTVQVTITVIPGPGLVRSIAATAIVNSDASDSNPANNIQSDTGEVRLRPFARN
ncbi:MAG TPA: choice-of-anchor Q domain-containing protein [Terriglobales bacterium]|jgi:hypothetical protein|nr:choice-of-anchor Q domain-containing protein [Terriglobales bacterium]